MRTGHDCSGEAVVQGLTPQSRIRFSGTLTPAESALWCVIWRWLGGALVWSEAGHQVNWFWGLLGVAGQGQPLLVSARGHLV